MKERKSKLDPFAEKIEQWFLADKLTLDEARLRLEALGCSVSASRLSDWWEAQRSARVQAERENRILDKITASRGVQVAVTDRFRESASNTLEALTVTIGQLAFDASARGEEPDIKTVADLAGYVLKARDLKLKEAQLALETRRVELLEKKAAAFDRAQQALESAKSAPGGLTPETLKKIEAELKLL